MVLSNVRRCGPQVTHMGPTGTLAAIPGPKSTSGGAHSHRISWVLIGIVVHERPASSRETFRKHVDADRCEKTEETQQDYPEKNVHRRHTFQSFSKEIFLALISATAQNPWLVDANSLAADSLMQSD
jgi:hypothetical protein